MMIVKTMYSASVKSKEYMDVGAIYKLFISMQHFYIMLAIT